MADVIRVGEKSEGSGGEMNNPVVDILGDSFTIVCGSNSRLLSISE